MSDSTDAEPDQTPETLPSLRDIFHKEITTNGGDSAAAFIEILDELDSRTGVTDQLIEQLNYNFELLAKWFEHTNHRFKKIPEQIETSTQRATDNLSATAERGAATGAKQGAAPSHDALEALRVAVRDYTAREAVIKRRAAIGLPLVFGAGLIAALLLGSVLIPALPQHWKWPCKIIGAEFRPNIDPDRATTFCVIVRE
ncbi:hypothetical protein [Loktanella sp. M215]|uniref:hypothetical protein n=1 Tax=Loktanella sp. M215 TaxID=2675431 RepID=UPI001F283323|nr:hypothetical protein [Loktanella sp. M215]MCF7702481.1 hypothetical protein [Loktanella sp. M215]MCF7702496.1 hypothetical protein [Loktanella sp. M215]